MDHYPAQHQTHILLNKVRVGVFSLFLLFSCFLFTQPNYDYNITFYDLDLTVDIEKRSIDGS